MLKNHRNKNPFETLVMAIAIVGILAVGFTSAQESESKQGSVKESTEEIFDVPQSIPEMPYTRLPAAQLAKAMPGKLVEADLVTKIKIYDLTLEQLKAAIDAGAFGEDMSEHKPYVTGNLNADDRIAFEKYCENAGISIVHTPHLVSRNGQTAELLSGGEIPLAVQKDGVDSVEFRPFGLKIQVTTKLGQDVDADCTIELTVENSFLMNNATDVPGFYTRRMSTGFRCAEGNTVMLGQHILQPNDKFFVDEDSEKIIRICLVESQRISPEKVEEMVRLPAATIKNRR